MKTSNKFTLARLISAPVLFFIYFCPEWLGAKDGSLLSIISVCLMIPLLALSELTDYFDGNYARKNNEVSDFGKMFDPFADVFLHMSMFTCFVFSGYMPVIFYVLIFYREFGQNFLRMVAAKKGTAIAARKGGKLKTVFYVVSCFVALAQEGMYRLDLVRLLGKYGDDVMRYARYTGYGFFAVCVLLAYISFVDYLKNFGSLLKDSV
ncbi:CDP-diacylglycerol--glycerol-3-phosphate 3-phosphatidyltransferase [Treponema sp.]|uniref:CDP-diacylglycerol--glycerol-3-phosphate 3-phosphatidyltransferase n=1 Tax=Treponema sp. TaxID=166 RepID=UPI0025D26B3E|nr:CDP-diacylglycerol--glycerol-3-phosphate 3-phosphatidyltransferase [Treponema sp.]MCR5218945.1 CDP-diacylglycerol--glycerol-3-phosphate 3-phosphatidyltransferase [Treponema sp.]